MSVQQAGETTYYNDSGVLVTNARAVLGGTTYPLANVSSVAVGEQVPSSAPMLVLALCFLASLFCAFGEDTRVIGISGLVIFGLLAFAAWQNSKPSYYVKVGSAGGEQKALAGHSKEEVVKIVAALNEAIIGRG